MKLKFKRQPFQEAAARAVCDVFRGQQNQIGRFTVDPGLVDDREISMMDSLGYKNAEHIGTLNQWTGEYEFGDPSMPEEPEAPEEPTE